MPRPITAADAPDRRCAIGVTIVTLDSHMASAVDRAAIALRKELPGLRLTLHALAEWGDDPGAAERCRDDIEAADIVIANMIFMEDHIRAVAPWLEARRDDCDCMIGCLSAGEIVKTTRLGGFSMKSPTGGAIGLLKRLRGANRKGRAAGRQQLKMLRQLPRILRFIPGKAQDMRAYFLTLQYMLAGSDENVANMVRYLVSRYAAGPRRHLREAVSARPPSEYPDTGVYHPALAGRVADDARLLPAPRRRESRGRVGLIVMRSYVLAGNTAHYDAMIAALEARGLTVVPVFAAGLDASQAVETFFMSDGRATVDAVLSLTGFSLIGGPAYNDSLAAETLLAKLDVPYLSAFAIEFKGLEQWRASEQGLTPVETTMMVALPEIDGAGGHMLYGGRSGVAEGRDMHPEAERVATLAGRIAKLVALRRSDRKDRKLAVVLFNFPPNGGATGTAAYLSVFRSLLNLLERLRAEGYDVGALPETADALRTGIIEGNAARHGTPANVLARLSADDHVRRERHLAEIERQWGPAPGRDLTDGGGIFVLGRLFGNVAVTIQPGFGYEGDPMRLLFEKNFAPTHAFSAFYRYLREDFTADAVLHFGTHGALEFMPGKQVGLSGDCWPDRLIGDLPNVYFYAANNPSEGTLAKRRANATLVSYLTPPVTEAGLYRGLVDLKGALDRWRATAPSAHRERVALAETIRAQAVALDLAEDVAWDGAATIEIGRVMTALAELESTFIPHGLHIAGEPLAEAARADMLAAVATAMPDCPLERSVATAIAAGETARDALARTSLPVSPERLAAAHRLVETNRHLMGDGEFSGLVAALDGRYVRPVAGGDIVRAPEIVPTGRNIHGFDPFRLPSAFALKDGRAQAERLLERHLAEWGGLPETIALVLWGTDNMKSEGGPIGQALALIGAQPRFDSYGRLAGADLVPLAELGRPRIDVVMTLSGIFRDLLPLQTKLLAEASFLAASADEPDEMNFVRKHARFYAETQGCDLEQAALRVFSNAAGTYGSNVNLLVDSGAWDDEGELADAYQNRKCFAYGRSGRPEKQSGLLKAILADVDVAYQNLESVELGVTSVDHYFDTLGGISRAVKRARGADVPVYVGDQTRGAGKVRTLAEQVALETRTRMLNPKFYEALLDHGYEGVRQIESHLTNTMGWSATTGQVAPWVYQNITETFVLDETMRRRLSELNPRASSKLANRLLEAHERSYWTPDEETLSALLAASDELEDRVEGISVEAAA
jgi:magnesium chelatase subunit H